MMKVARGLMTGEYSQPPEETAESAVCYAIMRYCSDIDRWILTRLLLRILLHRKAFHHGCSKHYFAKGILTFLALDSRYASL